MSIRHGTYSEGFAFVIRYLLETESYRGVLLILLFVLFLLRGVFDFARKQTHSLDKRILLVLAFTSVFGLAWHSYLGYMELMVFYGRTARLFFPLSHPRRSWLRSDVAIETLEEFSSCDVARNDRFIIL